MTNNFLKYVRKSSGRKAKLHFGSVSRLALLTWIRQQDDSNIGREQSTPTDEPARQCLFVKMIVRFSSLLFTLLLFAGASYAATFTVNSTIDANDSNPGNGICATSTGVCTLRAAIRESNALAGPDTIIVPSGTYRLTRTGRGEDSAVDGDLDINTVITINGAGAGSTIIEAGSSTANGIDRVFDIRSGATVILNGMTIRHGNSGEYEGGGIRNQANLTIQDTVVSANYSEKLGGGIHNRGSSATLTLVRVTVTGNSAEEGGGINNQESAQATVSDTTFSSNTASKRGGGFHNDAATATITRSTINGNSSNGGDSDGGGVVNRNSGTMDLTNVTISANSAGRSGGGIYNESSMTLFNLTVTGNTASQGGRGIQRQGGTVNVKNTIVAYNGSTNCSGGLTNQGNNLDSANTCNFSGSGGLINTNPLLGTLQDNGGPTQTHALLTGSPAIDTATASGAPSTDQRGVGRPQGAAFDIGAFELANVGVTLRIIKSNNGPWTVAGAGAVYSLTVSNIGGVVTSGTITALDTLPTGITPNWTGTRAVSSNGINWNCTFSGQNITCTTSNSINFTGTNSSVITLPVNIGTTANTGAPIINYASVGGGGDSFNGGTAPTPGAGCTDSNHCASNSLTITNQPPTANNITTSLMQNTNGNTSIPALTGNDTDGTVASFRIDSLPSGASGTLYLCNAGCTAVSAGQTIPLAQAGNLQFAPNIGFTGNAVFNYSAIDNLGAVSTAAAVYTIPLGYTIVCTNVYASAFSSGRTSIYELNGATMNPVISAPQTVGGLAVSPNGSAYYDNGTFTTPPLYRHDGSAQSDTGATVPGLLVGEAADGAGNVYYIDSSYNLRRVNAGAGGPASNLGAITFPAGDTIGPTLRYGDMTFDGNGRLYWYSSVNGSGATYLYIVNITTREARNVGQIGPNGATGAAFNGAGQLITTANSGQTVVSIDITSPTLAMTTLGTASPTIYDLGSCALPFFNPNLTAQKSVANITLGQDPAAVANINDILEYTVVVTNTGNLGSSAATLSDAIPAGTTYVAGTTTLNGTGVADVSGAMPYATTRTINSGGQPTGVINPGGGTATVRFRVQVNSSGLPPEIRNTATTQFTTTNGGADTLQTVESNETVTPTYLQPPNVDLVKSCPAPANCVAAPQLSGTDISYSIQFTNSGGQTATGLRIVDAVPLNTDFKLGSAAAVPGTTSLTFVIEYSADYDPNNPTAATWTYTPVSGGGGGPIGYDRLVKAIRWRATAGSLSNTAPNNTGSVNFIVRIS